VAFLRVQDRTTKTVRLFKANINAAQEVANPAVVSPATGKGNLSPYWLIQPICRAGTPTISA
jgi:hypothetical protein